jgi:hypothetical protein
MEEHVFYILDRAIIEWVEIIRINIQKIHRVPTALLPSARPLHDQNTMVSQQDELFFSTPEKFTTKIQKRPTIKAETNIAPYSLV